MTEPPKDAPAFDLYPERWIAGTMGMTETEELCYFRLILHAWICDGLPPEIPHLCRLARMRKIPDAVLEKFPIWTDGKRRNTRLEKVRQEQRERISKAKEKAKKMTAGRWKDHKKDIHKDSIRMSQEASNGDHLISPPPTTHLPPHKERESSAGAREAGDWPEKIVAAYPRRDSPMECMEVVATAIQTGEAPEAILQAVREVAALCNAAPGGADNQFVPRAKTFFLERQWRSPEAFRERWKPKTNGKPMVAEARDVSDWHKKKLTTTAP